MKKQEIRQYLEELLNTRKEDNMEKKNKVRRSYRINPLVYDEMKKILEKLSVNETYFIEMAIIEKIERIRHEKGLLDSLYSED